MKQMNGGQRLTLLRNTLSFSQQDLANATEVHAVTVSRIENANEKELHQYERSLNKIAKKLGVNPLFLITGKGSMWLTGTDEENVLRIKQASLPALPSANILESEIYRQQEERLKELKDHLESEKEKASAYKQSLDFFRAMVDSLRKEGKLSFKMTPGEATYPNAVGF